MTRTFLVLFALLIPGLASAQSLAWIDTFFDGLFDLGGDVVMMPDGGAIVTGAINVGPGIPEYVLRAFAMRVDAAGNVRWIDTLEASASSYGVRILDMGGGAYTIVGSRVDPARAGDIVLYTIDSAGRSQSPVIVQTDNEYESVVDAIRSRDGGFIVASTRSSGGGFRQSIITKLDASGSRLWSRVRRQRPFTSVSDVLESPIGDIFLTGVAGDDNNVFVDVYLHRLSSSGDSLAYWISSAPPVGVEPSIVTTADGRIALAYASFPGGRTNRDGVTIATFDALGTWLRDTSYSLSAEATGGIETIRDLSIHARSTGGYWLVWNASTGDTSMLAVAALGSQLQLLSTAKFSSPLDVAAPERIADNGSNAIVVGNGIDNGTERFFLAGLMGMASTPSPRDLFHAPTLELRDVSRDGLEIRYRLPFTAQAQLEVVDLRGCLVASHIIDASRHGEQRLRLPLYGIPAGKYLLRLSAEGTRTFASLVVR